MTDAVSYRGPDGQGIEWFSLAGSQPRQLQRLERDPSAWQAALGHRRLSILDLSSAGRQPMGRGNALWISYNGEIYNYVELRRELEADGHRFLTGTDTEVLLAAYQQWDVRCFERLRGMWGLVILDGAKGRAILSRDRLGIKPLFTSQNPQCLAVASEPKQLLHVPGMSAAPDEEHLLRYLLFGEDSAKSTFFADIQHFPAAHYQVVDLQTLQAGAPQKYWHPEHVSTRHRTRDEAAEAFATSFEESIAQHMRSDVPVGCALSGGLDSSSVAAAMHRRAPDSDLHTFTAAFPGHAIDESAFASELLASVPATPHVAQPTAVEFLEDLDTFIHHHDEPVGSLSQYAGFCVARATRNAGIPVTLNGQGGDEVFSAYWQCVFAHLLNLAQERHPVRLGRSLLAPLLPRGNTQLYKQVPAMGRRYWARHIPSGAVQAVGREPSAKTTRALSMSRAARRVWEITELTLPRLLKWDDRNFMAFSVEGRYPFLDHRLIELCLSFDDDALYWRGWTKEPLRHGLRSILPASIARRRTKVGFEVPTEAWMQQTLLSPMREALDKPGVVSELIAVDSVRAAHQKIERGVASREDLEAAFRVFNAICWGQQQLS